MISYCTISNLNSKKGIDNEKTDFCFSLGGNCVFGVFMWWLGWSRAWALALWWWRPHALPYSWTRFRSSPLRESSGVISRCSSLHCETIVFIVIRVYPGDVEKKWRSSYYLYHLVWWHYLYHHVSGTLTIIIMDTGMVIHIIHMNMVIITILMKRHTIKASISIYYL